MKRTVLLGKDYTAKKILSLLLTLLMLTSVIPVAVSAVEYDETSVESYLVVTKHTDIELNDHVVLTAIIDGSEKSIKVKTINEKNAEGEVLSWAVIPDLDADSLDSKLADIFGVYTYTVDADGFYTLTRPNINMHLKDYVSSVEDGYVSFQDWETVGTLDANQNGNTHDEIIRVSSNTLIYVVDAENRSVGMIKPQSYFTIYLNGDTDPLFMIDRIGYGNSDKEYADGIGYGVASVICIETSDEYVNESEYKLVYVQENVSSASSGSATDYALKSGDVDETYFKYAIEDEEAFLSTETFSEVEEIYVSETYRTGELGGAKLVAGLYLLNYENIVIDHKTVSKLLSEAASERYFNYGNAKIAYDVWDVAGDDIDIYNYKHIVINGYEDLIGSNIQTIKFRFFEEIDGELIATDLKNDRLVDYMTENYCTITKPDEDDAYTWTYDYDDVRVLIIPNAMSGFDKYTGFANNTLAGIVIREVKDLFCGDVDGNGVIEPTDSVALSRHLAKWTGYSENDINLANADVDGINGVDATDGVVLSRHLAKWTGYETLPIEE